MRGLSSEVLIVKDTEITNSLTVYVNVNQSGEPLILECCVMLSDKVEMTLQDTVMGVIGNSGSLYTDSKCVGEDDTFASLQINDKQKFIMVLAGACRKRVEPSLWRRSKFVQNESYTGSYEYPDALIFVARQDVKIYGFMWNKEWNKKEFTLKF